VVSLPVIKKDPQVMLIHQTISGRPVFNSDGSPMMVDEQQPLTLIQSADPPIRLVIIHDTDADGIAAAWCISTGLGANYSETVLIPQRAGTNTIPPDLTENDAVYLLDRCYPFSVLAALSEVTNSVTVIDHHRSAIVELYEATRDYEFPVEDVEFHFSGEGCERTKLELWNLTITIDTTHSACMLAHIYVLEHGTEPTTPVGAPWFIRYIEDRDIWKWELPDSKDINAGLYFEGHTFDNYDMFHAAGVVGDKNSTAPNLLRDTIDGIRRTGSILNNQMDRHIKSIAHGPTVTYFTTNQSALNRVPYNTLSKIDNPHSQSDPVLKVAMVCCPFYMISDLGNFMLFDDTNKNGPMDVVIVYNHLVDDVVDPHNPNLFTYSMRSKTVDVAAFAKSLNGGGHVKAAGFTSNIAPYSLRYNVSIDT